MKNYSPKVEKNTDIYPNVKIQYESSSYKLIITIIGTGNPRVFYIYLYPTNNCQVTSVSSMKELLIAVFAGLWYKEGIPLQDITKEMRAQMFKDILYEIYHFIHMKSYGFKQAIIDIESGYKKFLTDEFIDIPKDYYVFSNDYVSTNGTNMCMSLIRIEQLLNYWENEEKKQISK